MDDGKKTPREHPDFHSYVKIQRISYIPDIFLVNTLLLYFLSPYSQTERQRESQINPGCAGIFLINTLLLHIPLLAFTDRQITLCYSTSLS